MTPLLLAALLSGAPDVREPGTVNLLSLEAGGFAVSTPPSYGGSWSTEALVDGDPASGWCSAADSKGPWPFVFELEQRSLVSAVTVDNAHSEESSYPGISASALEVWVSSSGPAENFTKVATVPLKRGGAGRVTLPKETYARWVKLVVPGNLGDKRYTELMEVAVLGHALEPAPARSFNGVWAIEGGGLLKLTDDGGALSGCWTWATTVQTLKGTSRGRAASLSAVDVLTDAAGKVALVLSDSGALRGLASGVTWNGLKRTDVQFDCRTVAEDVRFARRVASERLGVVLGGVTFDLATDELRLDATNELGALARMLAPAGGKRARVLVLGRTTEPAPDELKRCERRAQRLLQALQQGGVPAKSVEMGVGLLKTGAAVQVEPRVEVLLLD